MSDLTVKVVTYSEELAAIKMIRTAVFQTEQGVDPALEFDGEDEGAIHLVAYRHEQPIGTARIRMISDRLAKLERMAVLSQYRGQGVGRQIMERAIGFLKSKNIPEVKMNAQIQAQPFYQKLGFSAHGQEFEEAGIPHIEMRKPLI